MGPGVPNPETAEGGNTEDDLIQTPNVDRDKMMLFSFIKHVILGKMNKETQNGPTHTGKAGLEPPTPHKDEQIELQAKLLNYFLGSNKSNINQSLPQESTPRNRKRR